MDGNGRRPYRAESRHRRISYLEVAGSNPDRSFMKFFPRRTVLSGSPSKSRTPCASSIRVRKNLKSFASLTMDRRPWKMNQTRHGRI